MSLLLPRTTYKPFRYPWCYEAWVAQNKIHWLPEEVPLHEDVKDWAANLTGSERHLLTQIFRFFTQADVEVGDCYMTKYLQVFRPPEVRMMLAGFANTECIHMAAYSHLIDTIGLPETEYQVFLAYKAMKDKYDYLQAFNVTDRFDVAKTMAAFGAFTEGLQLFASFAILLNFPRRNLMKGMGQIITWSVRDETLHCDSIIKLYHTFLQENPELNTRALQGEILTVCTTMVEHEDAFIDLAFEQGPVEGLTAEETKAYIRYTADRRLVQLGLKPHYNVGKNPLPWLDEMLNAVEFANFFEARATEYSRGATGGTWGDVFSEVDTRHPITEGQEDALSFQ